MRVNNICSAVSQGATFVVTQTVKVVYTIKEKISSAVSAVLDKLCPSRVTARTLQGRVTVLTKENEQLKTQSKNVVELSSKNVGLLKEVRKLKRECSAKEGERERFETGLTQAAKDVVTARREVDLLKQDLAEADADLDQKIAEVESLRDQLERASVAPESSQASPDVSKIDSCAGLPFDEETHVSHSTVFDVFSSDREESSEEEVVSPRKNHSPSRSVSRREAKLLQEEASVFLKTMEHMTPRKARMSMPVRSVPKREAKRLRDEASVFLKTMEHMTPRKARMSVPVRYVAE
jgi:hypothetical protein